MTARYGHETIDNLDWLTLTVGREKHYVRACESNPQFGVPMADEVIPAGHIVHVPADQTQPDLMRVYTETDKTSGAVLAYGYAPIFVAPSHEVTIEVKGEVKTTSRPTRAIPVYPSTVDHTSKIVLARHAQPSSSRPITHNVTMAEIRAALRARRAA